MMESCLVGKLERVGPVTVDDIRRDLLDEFSALPAQDSIHSQSENLQVYLRVRPFTAAESESGEPQDCVTIEGPDTVILRAPRTSQSNRQSEKLLSQTAQRFTFTQVFGPDASQRKVFDGSVRNLVQDVLEGGNCLVFTYGVTNAGKTFTFLGPEHDGGLLPRSLAVIFNSIESRLYGRCDLKPQRCRDFSRLTPDQQASEMSSKKNLMRLLKETDRNQMSGRSTFLDGSSLSSNGSINSTSEAESFCLDVNSNIRFSVWVSFCEIYNDNIHDLLEQVSIGQNRRTVLRLSQDVKGNSFIKDLRWVQVNSAEEAYRVMKIGRKNQSFSATRLNQLSSRSHSIFSIRILRVDDIGVPRVLGISELALCDLAGSERCSRTHNTGERLKEAGNINNSLLTLGKCISAMRLNQNSKFQHHIPFRESKLTHFLQFFFCGAGRVSMVVNINQNSSCVDETLNVLKFSALAQKVVMVNTRPVVLDEAPTRSAMELSMIIDEAEQHRNGTGRGRKSSLVAWETSLEDVLEDEDGEEEENDDNDESMMEGTVLEAGREEDEDDSDQTMEEEEGSDRDAALRLVLEAQIREEVSAEFMELFNKMEKDYSDRLEKEREMLEERAERRVEILKNLVSKTVNMSSIDTNDNKEEQVALLEGIISSMSQDLEKIKADAQSVHRCLTEQAQAAELETLRLEKQNSEDQLQEASENLEKQQQKLSELVEMCQQKDGIINTLQAAMDRAAEESTRDREVVESIRTEMLQLQQNCHCLRTVTGSDEKGERKRQRDAVQDEGEGEKGGPAKKRVLLEEEIWRLQEENERKEQTIIQLREKEGMLMGQEEELRKQEEELRRREQQLLTGATQEECPHCDTILSSLDSERRDISRLTKENKALVNGIFQLQTQVTRLQEQHGEQNQQLNSKVEQLTTTKANLQKLERQTDEKDTTIKCLTQEVECLQQKIKKEETERCASSTVYRTAMEELKKESQVALESSTQKTQQIQDLKIEKEQLQAQLNHSESRCEQLREELASQRADYISKLQSLRSELESEGGAQRMKEEEIQKELKATLSEKEKLLEDSLSQIATLRRELEHLQKELWQQQEEEKENQVMQGTKLTVVEELKEEMQRLQRKKELQRKQQQGEEERTFEAVKRELECHTQKVLRSGGRVLSPDVHLSPLRSNTAVSRKTPKTRKRKSCEVGDLVCSENKRNRQRGNTRNCKQDKTEETLQKKIGDLIHNSPSILGKTAKTIIGFVSEHTVTTTTKPKRGRRKLYKTEVSSPMLVSPMCAGGDDEKESDHQIIKRQLRSKTCKK